MRNWGGLVDNNLTDLEEMNRAGVIGYKAFASASGIDFARLNDDLIYAGLEKIRALGNLLGLHAENEWVCAYLGRQLRPAAGTIGPPGTNPARRLPSWKPSSGQAIGQK